MCAEAVEQGKDREYKLILESELYDLPQFSAAPTSTKVYIIYNYHFMCVCECSQTPFNEDTSTALITRFPPIVFLLSGALPCPLTHPFTAPQPPHNPHTNITPHHCLHSRGVYNVTTIYNIIVFIVSRE